MRLECRTVCLFRFSHSIDSISVENFFAADSWSARCLFPTAVSPVRLQYTCLHIVTKVRLKDRD